jgi:hypothetical protein
VDVQREDEFERRVDCALFVMSESTGVSVEALQVQRAQLSTRTRVGSPSITTSGQDARARLWKPCVAHAVLHRTRRPYDAEPS